MVLFMWLLKRFIVCNSVAVNPFNSLLRTTTIPRAKVSKNFYEDELIPPAIYNNRRLKNEWFIDKQTLKIQQSIRDYYGPITINNWWHGGPTKYRGYRHPACKVGSKLSMHRHMKAADNVPKECEAKKIVDDIIYFNRMIMTGNPDRVKIPWFAYYITCVEYSIKGRRPSWAHWDTRPTRERFGLLILKL